MKDRKKKLYMDIAIRISEMSYATKYQVGSVIEKDGNILSFGFNGMPAGFDNTCEYVNDEGLLKTFPEVIHSEINAISKCAKMGISCNGANLFVTLSPCYDCAKLLIQSGIKTVYYLQLYKHTGPIEFLEKAGIKCECLEEIYKGEA